MTNENLLYSIGALLKALWWPKWEGNPKKREDMYMGFHDSSAGKESACNAGLVPGLERSAGEGIGYPLYYSWTSLVGQLVKNLPAMWETWVWSLGWEDPLQRGMATHSSILDWRIPWTLVHGVAKSWTWLSTFHLLNYFKLLNILINNTYFIHHVFSSFFF